MGQVTGEVVEQGSGRPLGGVSVSDGLHVVATDGEGRFALDLHPDAELLFVTVPATHHALEPGWFVDVRDPGTRLAHHTFALAPRADGIPDRARFLHVTDLHVALDGGDRLRQLLEAGVPAPPGVDTMTAAISEDELRADLAEAVARERPAFVAATGDLGDHGEAGELAAYLRAVEGLGVPVAHGPGNHDYMSSLDQDAIMRFVAWLQTDGRDQAAEPFAAFQDWMFGGDWRRPDSGRRPWLDVVGPPYWSFDWGPAHFVVYDSESRLRYGDAYPQERWLAADLARLAPGTPVVALLHFAEPMTFFDQRFGGVRLMASLAGHWHCNRRLEHGGAVHYVTATTGFSGYDHSARGYRVVEVDGEGVRSWYRSLEDGGASRAARPGRLPSPPTDGWPAFAGSATRTGRAPASLAPPLGVAWEADLGGTPTIGSPVVTAGLVVLAVGEPDGTGVVLALDAATGERRWAHEEPSAVSHSPVVAGDLVVAVTVTGAVVALDAATGETRWRAQLGDPGLRWCFGAPVVAGDAVVAGGSGHLAALALADGALRWARTDLATDDWPSAWGSPAAADGVVVAAFANERVHLCAFDAATGETRWKLRGHELVAPCSSPVVVGDRVVAATVNGFLVAWSLEAGARLWSTPLAGPWPVATPAADDERAYALDSTGALHAIHLADGDREWTLALGPARQARRPYERAPAGHPASPVIAGAHVWAVGAGGRLVAIDPAKGAEAWSLDLGVACWSSPAAAAGVLFLPTGAGTLAALVPEAG